MQFLHLTEKFTQQEQGLYRRRRVNSSEPERKPQLDVAKRVPTPVRGREYQLCAEDPRKGNKLSTT
jgi:hypothetical protein